MNDVTVHRALISVSDKTGMVDFARSLREFGVEIISTGGTLKVLLDAGIQAKSVTDVTGFPEILNGRVKTLHPKIHAGLLAQSDNPDHQRQLKELGIEPIELVAVNLYPFEKTIESEKVTLEEAIEQIDIGGPSMLRAAAKNFRSRIVASNPAQYPLIISEMKKTGGAVSESTRFELAREVFLTTARYDAAILKYLGSVKGREGESPLPRAFSLFLPLAETLRYGENPHQHAGLYGNFHDTFQKLHGKELSYNNIVDIQAAAALAEEFDEPTVAIIKHTNPCGVASSENLSDAYGKAFATDTKSAYGGVIAVNRELDRATADEIDKIFSEVVIAPRFGEGVLEFLKRKKDRRLIRQLRPLAGRSDYVLKQVAGGFLIQTPDEILAVPENMKVVTRRAPTEQELSAMMFGWRVAKHVKSNAIVYSLPDRTIGIGAGQMSRVDSSRIAVMKAAEMGLDLKGTAVASDAYFPFADGLLEAVKAGASAVIQPGGSIRDGEVIKAADDNNIAMIFTGIRHFRH